VGIQHANTTAAVLHVGVSPLLLDCKLLSRRAILGHAIALTRRSSVISNAKGGVALSFWSDSFFNPAARALYRYGPLPGKIFCRENTSDRRQVEAKRDGISNLI
jgi:hypothetical protein